MDPSNRPIGRLRWVASAFFCIVLAACAFAFLQMSNPSRFTDGERLDLAGEWQFHNGALASSPSDFSERVQVPEPLPARLRDDLQSEFWYRKEFKLTDSILAQGEDLALTLGSVKGEHEIYWNGQYLGAGGKVGLSLHRIPKQFLQGAAVEIKVRVRNGRSLFPGIVHMNAIGLFSAASLESQLNAYYFDAGVKPLLPSVLKLSIFFLFLGLFIAVPVKKEYFLFSVFGLLGGASSLFYSRFVPGYDDVFFKNGMIFLFFVLSLSLVPGMAADLLRWGERQRSWARSYGFSLAIVFMGAALFTESLPSRLAIYRLANDWIPLLVCLPAAAFCAHSAFALERHLFHRRVQLGLFSGFLFAGMLAWGSGAGALLQFKLFEYREFLDLVVVFGLGVSIALDFRMTFQRSLRAERVVPKWFSSFLSGGMENVTLEIPMIAMAVDTAGYTRRLQDLDEEEKKRFHAAIREELGRLTESLGAQKISERGDGGLFGWDLPLSSEGRERVFRQVLEASRRLAMAAREPSGLSFRVGIAAGIVRGEMRAQDISFLGEALNAASRLENLAEPGTALVDESLVAELPEGQLGHEWVEAELKGVIYRARPLRLAA